VDYVTFVLPQSVQSLVPLVLLVGAFDVVSSLLLIFFVVDVSVGLRLGFGFGFDFPFNITERSFDLRIRFIELFDLSCVGVAFPHKKPAFL